jgi:hypothetical protein
MTSGPKHETPAEFSQRAGDLLRAALRASTKQDGGDHSALNRCMSQAKARRMTWVEGLEYSIATLNSSN